MREQTDTRSTWVERDGVLVWDHYRDEDGDVPWMGAPCVGGPLDGILAVVRLVAVNPERDLPVSSHTGGVYHLDFGFPGTEHALGDIAEPKLYWRADPPS